jgi:hypothetical protein
MIPFTLSAALAAALLPGVTQPPQPAGGDATSLAENLALQALASGDRDRLRRAAEVIAALDEPARRALAVRVRDDEVAFGFRGEFPAKEFSANMFEFVIAAARTRDYETFLTAGPAEMARLQKVAEAVGRLNQGGRRPELRVTLAWVEDGQPRVEDLRDVLRLLDPAARAKFTQALQLHPAGLYAENVQADPAALPKQRTPVWVWVAARLPAAAK